MIVGICGLGFVGKAIYSFMNDSVEEVVVYDKYKQINTLDALLCADILYICISTPYVDTMKSYNMDEIDTTLFLLNELNYAGIILIKSTVLPIYCESINNTYPALNIVHNPEFLSAATAIKDFSEQSHIILGYTEKTITLSINKVAEFYKTLFPQAVISITSSTTSALTKLACNSFYATKVQFFTEIFLLCNKIDVDFNEVKELMLQNKWIHPMHTSVPGSDGQVSFGGACLPKDITALNQFISSKDSYNSVLEAVIQERNSIRID
jgi:nucleotide sugar dehydrogenase